MAQVYAYQDVSTSTVNGFYVMGASNPSTLSSTSLVLNTIKYIPVTYSVAGNVDTFIIALSTGLNYGLASSFKNVRVALQHFVGGIWTPTTTTVTLSGNQIANSVQRVMGIWKVPFVCPIPAAINTNASEWRWAVDETGAGSDWRMLTSDATNAFYGAPVNNATSLANNDCLWVGDCKVLWDVSITLKGVLPTGDAVNAMCGVFCRRTTPTAENAFNLYWTESASHVLTLDGAILVDAHSGFKAGVSGTPITFANQSGIIAKGTPTVGSRKSGVTSSITANYGMCKPTLVIYGESPTYQTDTLSVDANAGQKNVTTSHATGWKNGWQVFIGKENIQGTGNTATNTLNGDAVGAGIVLTNNIAGQNRISGRGSNIMTTDGYGFYIKCDVSNNFGTFNLEMPSVLHVEGFYFYNININLAYAASYKALDDTANSAKYIIRNGAMYNPFLSLSYCFRLMVSPVEGSLMENVCAMTAIPCNGIYKSTENVGGVKFSSGTCELSHCTVPKVPNTFAGWITNTAGNTTYNSHDNVITNGTYLETRSGLNSIYKNNYYWGASIAAIYMNGLFDPAEISGNYYQNNAVVFTFVPSAIITNAYELSPHIGDEVANTIDANFDVDGRIEYIVENPSNVLNIDTTNLPYTIAGSRFGVASDGNIANQDVNYYTYYNLTRTGWNLPDTTVRLDSDGSWGAAATSDDFALKIRPLDDTFLSVYPNNNKKRFVPIGNLQATPFTVSCYIKLNSANYYAGAKYIMPTLKVNYDNGTIESAVATVASLSGERLSLNIEPATSFGQISVTIESATDAIGTNADFYVDKFVVAYPGGKKIDLGGLTYWADGEPITPPIATFDLGGVWDAVITPITGSTGYWLYKLYKWAKRIKLFLKI